MQLSVGLYLFFSTGKARLNNKLSHAGNVNVGGHRMTVPGYQLYAEYLYMCVGEGERGGTREGR